MTSALEFYLDRPLKDEEVSGLFLLASLPNVGFGSRGQKLVVQVGKAVCLFDIGVVVTVPILRIDPLVFPVFRVYHGERILHDVSVLPQLDPFVNLEVLAYRNSGLNQWCLGW